MGWFNLSSSHCKPGLGPDLMTITTCLRNHLSERPRSLSFQLIGQDNHPAGWRLDGGSTGGEIVETGSMFHMPVPRICGVSRRSTSIWRGLMAARTHSATL